ncbi:MAG: hypothetical protein DRJ03_29390 [Chloroflexi bacterium]|nr:MAG: hypothetical protein DRJ03_29390 [Chloroflexota bacterium]
MFECEICLTAQGAKPGSIIPLPYKAVLRTCEILGLRPPYYVSGVGCVFISSSLKWLSWLLLLDITEDPVIRQAVYGIFCGYPRCCIYEYLMHGNLKVALQAYRSKVGKRKDPFSIRKVTGERVVSDRLISWIPCSPNCRISHELVKFYERVCRRRSECPFR